MTSTCQLDEALQAQIEALRLDKNLQGNAAIICKIINQETLLIVQEHSDDGFLGIEELWDKLPLSAPRYVVLSIKLDHHDGRVSYPMVFVNYSPKGVKPEFNMLYASSKTQFQKMSKTTKTLEVDDAELLSLKWLHDKLK